MSTSIGIFLPHTYYWPIHRLKQACVSVQWYLSSRFWFEVCLPWYIPTILSNYGKFYLDPSCNSVMNRCWIPRYRRAVIGWDKNCRSRVISSREWNELPWKRNVKRLTLFLNHYKLQFPSMCLFLKSQLNKQYLRLIILTEQTAILIFWYV